MFDIKIGCLDKKKSSDYLILKLRQFNELTGPCILINYLIPKNTNIIHIEIFKTIETYTDCSLNILDKNNKIIKDFVISNNLLKTNLEINITNESIYLDFIIVLSSINKKNDSDNMELSVFDNNYLNIGYLYPFIIYNAETFKNAKLHLKNNYLPNLKNKLYLFETECAKEYSKLVNIKYCSEIHYYDCKNTYFCSIDKKLYCSGLYLELNKDKYCNLLDCLYQCKFGFDALSDDGPCCVVQQFRSVN